MVGAEQVLRHDQSRKNGEAISVDGFETHFLAAASRGGGSPIDIGGAGIALGGCRACGGDLDAGGNEGSDSGRGAEDSERFCGQAQWWRGRGEDRDVGDFRGVVAGGHIAPRNRHDRGGVTPEIYRLQAGARGNVMIWPLRRILPSGAAYPIIVFAVPGENALAGVEAKPAFRGIGPGGFELGDRAVGRDDVKTGAGTDDDVGRLCCQVIIVGGLEVGFRW